MHHAKAHNIEENLYPLLAEDPAAFLYQHPHTAAVSSGNKPAGTQKVNMLLHVYHGVNKYHCPFARIIRHEMDTSVAAAPQLLP
jgi:hypothetical protein